MPFVLKEFQIILHLKLINLMKKIFYLKLVPPRPTFAMDMNDEERKIMTDHVAYWRPFVADGTMIVMGPVIDPNGVFGMGVIQVDDEKELENLIAKDPANGLNQYEKYPIMAISNLIV